MKDGGYTFFEAIEYACKIGFDAIEFTDVGPEAKAITESTGDIVKAVKDSGLELSSYDVRADFLYGSDGDTKKEVERLKACLDLAKKLGAPMLRHDVCWGLKNNKCRTWREAVKIMAPAIREVTEYAASLGIKTMTENHGQFLQESSRMEELVLSVNHPNYGLLVDMGNFMCADETSIIALATAMPYAFHVHAKDFLYKSGVEGRPDDCWFPTRGGNYLRGTILGHGVVSVAQCINYVKKTGYTGCLSLEFEGAEEPLDAIRRGFEYMKKCTQDE